MSDFDRGKIYKKKYHSSRDSRDNASSFNRSFFSSKTATVKSEELSKESKNEIPKMKTPTILIKAREQTEEVTGSPKKAVKDSESTGAISATATTHEGCSLPSCKQMFKSVKFLDDGMLLTENLQDFVQENNDFLVVGVVGPQSVGKSTILNFLAHDTITDHLKNVLFNSITNPDKGEFDGVQILTENLANINIKSESETEIFKVQDVNDAENNRNCTNGIDAYISSNRIIFLDCQPFMSVSVLDELVESENKRSSLVSEFIPSENTGEIQGLQLTSFLMSVCHVLLVVQDWFFDSNVVRFIQTAEMLKPTISNPEDELLDHFPHLLLIHNKAQVEDFSPLRFKTIQQIYKSLFHKTKLLTETNIGIGSGRVIKHLNATNCGSPMNIYLIPEYNPLEILPYKGHPPLEDLIRRLRANVLGATKHPLTHVQLTEKTWLVYCAKAWDNVKKSSFFVEYTKLMP